VRPKPSPSWPDSLSGGGPVDATIAPEAVSGPPPWPARHVDPGQTSFRSAIELASAMTRAWVAHGEHEKRIGHADPDWPDWYAGYMVAEQAGAELPQ
jgi:hypothetical protein